MLALTSLVAMAHVVKLFVSPLGSDSNEGSAKLPLKTLGAAQVRSRKYRGKTVVVSLAKGIYRLQTPLQFTTQDSGDLTFQGQQGAVISSGIAFKPQWKPFRKGIVQCQVPVGFTTDQLFVNGKKQILARYPNEDLGVRIFHGFAKDAVAPERVASWKDPDGGFFHAMHAYMWGDFTYRILGKDQQGKLRLEGGWQNNRPSEPHPDYRFVEGIFEELDAPGEWFLNSKSHTLYFYPPKDLNLSNSLVEGPNLAELIRIDGASGIKFKDLTFTHTLRIFMENREPLLRSDWTTFRGGALYFRDSHGCAVEDCNLENLGGNALFVDGKNRNFRVQRCRIENVGANGVAFVGSPRAVRSPLFNADQTQSYASIDKVPGPKSDDYPADCLVEDCLIDNTGTVEKQTAGVQIAMASRITVRHCSIYHVPRAGINIGDGCWGGHVIEGCDVFDTVLETGDHGSFNSWGRDRYWNLTDVDMTKGEHPDLAALDTVEPTILKNNRWRCDHGWDIDLDDGSSRYIIQNNLCLAGGLKNREGFGRIVENNVIVNNSFHPHVWFHNSGDVFRGNIVFTAYKPIGMPSPWGLDVDNNFFHKPLVSNGSPSKPTPATELMKQSGRDVHSLEGDALFVNPSQGDFQVKEGSPAFRLGFKNFPMNEFGVRTPRLRKLAQQPRIGYEADVATSVQKGQWLGAELKDLSDPNDLSAVGLGAGKGVLIDSLRANSKLLHSNVLPLDVILTVNGKAVTSVKQLLQIVSRHEKESASGWKLTLWRNQKKIELLLSLD